MFLGSFRGQELRIVVLEPSSGDRLRAGQEPSLQVPTARKVGVSSGKDSHRVGGCLWRQVEEENW